MSAPPPVARDMWRLIDSVRDRSYDLFTFAEKQKMHDLVTAFKAKGIVSDADIDWLKQSYENLRSTGVSPARFSRRRLPRAKRRPRDNG
jgi:hypothetical protein